MTKLGAYDLCVTPGVTAVLIDSKALGQTVTGVTAVGQSLDCVALYATNCH